MATDKKKTVNVICESCDSEYLLKFAKTTVNGNPVHCAFCGEILEEEQEDMDDFDIESEEGYEE